MKLRIRITLGVSLCFVAVAGGLALEGRMREWQVEQRYREVRLAGYRNTLTGIATAELQRLATAIPAIGRNDRALRALVQRDPEAYADSLMEWLLNLQADSAPVRFETATLDGQLFFGSGGFASLASVALADAGSVPSLDSDAAPRILSPPLIAAALGAGQPVTGLARLTDGRYGLTVAFPLLDRAGPTAVGALALDVAPLLPALAASIDAAVFLLHLDGSLVQGSDPDVWRRLERIPTLDRSAGVRVERRGNQVYTLAWSPLRDLFGRETARLLIVEEITAAYWRRLLLDVLAHGGIIVGLALFLGGLHWSLRRAFRPLNHVIGALNALAGGDTRIPALAADLTQDDEISRLTGATEQFRQAQEARGQLLGLRQELQIAARIQRALLPARFPERPEFALYAELHTVGEVGGDFYDGFELPDGRIGLAIADVSDKGIAAALFMAMARTVIRSVARIVPEPGACLERANTLLSEDNVAAMFVTIFYGVLDPTTGRFRYANAGHNRPYHLTADATVTALAPTGGMALGAIEGLAFAEGERVLRPGERLLFYTDGVTEALDPAGGEFTTARLEAVLAAAPAEPDALIAAVVGAVRTFAGATPQTDDLTLMALTYHGPDEAESRAGFCESNDNHRGS